MKLDSCNLHHYKRNCCKLVFWVFPERLLSHIIFEQLHCYEVTLDKKYFYGIINLYFKNMKQRFSTEEDFMKNLLQVNEKNTLAF